MRPEPVIRRKSARLRRANEDLWTAHTGVPTSESKSIAASAATSIEPPFASGSAFRSYRTTVSDSAPTLHGPTELHSTDELPTRRRLRLRALQDTHDSLTVSVTSQGSAASGGSASQSKQNGPSRDIPSGSRVASSPAPATPKAQAVVGDSTSPFWSSAGGIFQPDAQNPIPVFPVSAQGSPQLVSPSSPSNQPSKNTPEQAAISALLFDPLKAQQTMAASLANPAPSTTPTLRRIATPSHATSAISSPSANSLLETSNPSAPSIVTETRATIATSSSLLLTTTLVSASQSSGTSSSSTLTSSSSSSAAASASASPSTSFFATLGSSTVNITITVLVCIGILALVIAFLFFFIRRCQRRRKRRRLGDILGSEFGTPGGNGNSGMSEWATPGPGWTEKYYGEQIGGRMVGTAGLGGGRGSSASVGHEDEIEQWQREFAGMGLDRDMEGGYSIARTLSQEKRTSDWANHRPGSRGGPDEVGELFRRGSEDDVADVWPHGQPLPAVTGSNQDHPRLAVPAPAAIRPRSEPDFTLLAAPQPTSRPRPRPAPTTSHSYSSYASESMYPIDEIGDIAAEKKELSETMSALSLGDGSHHTKASSSPSTQTSWRDSLDWVMGSAADLIGSKLLARGSSADTLVATPPEKQSKENDRFTTRPPSIRVPRGPIDPLAVSDTFTPLSPSYGDRFLQPRGTRQVPATLSRQSSLASFTSSANFATTTQQGTFAQSARSRLFDASVAQHAREEDEMEILDDVAAAMMSRQTTNVTTTSDVPLSLPRIPYPHFDTTPLSTPRRYVASPADMSRTSSTSTSSSFTYRPTPPQNPFLTPPEMHQNRSSSSMGSNASFDAFGRGGLTPREYDRRRSSSDARNQRKKNSRSAAAMEAATSLTSISTFEENDFDYFSEARTRQGADQARVLMGERRRRSEGSEPSLV